MTQEASIRNIAFYLVKGCAGTEVIRARLTRSGLVVGGYADHQFMVVSNDLGFIEANEDKKQGVYNFVTQRDRRNADDKSQSLSIMASVKPSFVRDRLSLSSPYQSSILLPPDIEGSILHVNVWGDVCQAVDQGDVYAQWFSDHLGMHVRLVKAGGPFSRTARQDYVANENDVKFQDAYPIHWFPIESVIELSERAQRFIPWQRFRPQVVVECMEPQFEHKAGYGKISGLEFFNGKPCDRCSVTLVDQDIGLVVRGGEPLRTLNKYKRWRKPNGKVKVIFGENVLPLQEGEIALGDPFVVTSLRDPPLVYGAKV